MLEAVDAWGAQTAAVAVVDDDGLVAVARAAGSRAALGLGHEAGDGVRGPGGRAARACWRSTTPAGPPGSTVRHLLAHAGGYGFDGGVLAAPGRTRIYSNTGFDTLGEVLEAAAGRPFAELLARVGAGAARDDAGRGWRVARRRASSGRPRTWRRSRTSCWRRRSCRRG